MEQEGREVGGGRKGGEGGREGQRLVGDLQTKYARQNSHRTTRIIHYTRYDLCYNSCCSFTLHKRKTKKNTNQYFVQDKTSSIENVRKQRKNNEPDELN